MTSMVSFGTSLHTSAMRLSGDMKRLKALIPRRRFRTGLVRGSMCMSTHNLLARLQNRSWMVAMWASASATPVATLVKDPMIACAPILCTRWIAYADTVLHACIQTLEA
ncbi:hypothetical protein NW760_015478 [Fusarium oxysporum]|nr:hypothetical protein NW760_015478 [Fusarium oxysporum]